ncbi:hypothetical protein GUITHDRAFT_154341, partial [Guillardia theta CCMP2712]
MTEIEKVDFRWSENHVAHGIKIDRLGTSAIRTDFFQVGSVRTAQPIPPDGMYYFEMTVKRPGKHVGSMMGGFYWLGICTDEVDNWDGVWWKDYRKEFCWAMRSESDSGSSRGDTQGRAELLSPHKKQADVWVSGSAVGSGSVVGFCVDSSKGKLWFYRDQELVDERPAFRELPRDVDLFAFVTLYHPGSSAQISARHVPSSRPDDDHDVAGFDGFYTCWSREFVGPGLKLSSNLLRAAFENKVSQGKSMSVRSEAEIPLDIGEHFFELSISIPGQHKGACLQGGFTSEFAARVLIAGKERGSGM